jgi:membrane-anchored protein YejM (alkaline phosphatase superfamily)
MVLSVVDTHFPWVSKGGVFLDDELVNKLTKMLKRGDLNNTFVVFASDHGGR